MFHSSPVPDSVTLYYGKLEEIIVFVRKHLSYSYGASSGEGAGANCVVGDADVFAWAPLTYTFK
jgi:hypothetical protein